MGVWVLYSGIIFESTLETLNFSPRCSLSTFSHTFSCSHPSEVRKFAPDAFYLGSSLALSFHFKRGTALQPLPSLWARRQCLTNQVAVLGVWEEASVAS